MGMTQAQRFFEWHPRAQLFAGTQGIMPPAHPSLTDFQTIDAKDTRLALTRLAQALGTGAGFCLFEGGAPEGCVAPHLSFLTLTGGSSGAPKAILRTQTSWIASFLVNSDMFRLTAHDTVAVLGRLSHSLALYGVVEGLHLGLNVQALDTLTPSDQRKAMRDHKTSVLYATPTQLRLLLRKSTAPLPDLRLVLCGGGRLDATTARDMARRCPNADLRVFYGSAETSFIAMADTETPSGAVGKAYPGVTFELRGTDGEIWVKSPYLFEGYADETTPIPRDADGFVSIGELGECSDDGTLTIKGRKTRVVNIADQTVHLEAVERVIADFDAGGTCAVLARADVTRGHHLVAVLEGPGDPQRADAVKRHCRVMLSALVAPKMVYFRDTLPLLPSGKTDLRALGDWLEQQT